jgi:phosphomannomutase
VPSAETPTGFKWIMRAGSPRAPLVFGYEEALGYAVAPSVVNDKDGISAALAVALLAAELKALGRTLVDRLDELALEHGLFVTGQLSVRVEDLSLIADAMARLRRAAPTRLAGSPVVTVTDLSEGSAELPPTDGLLYLTAQNDRVVVRPSGTEPKLKCYLEVVVPVADPTDVAATRRVAATRLERLRADVAAAVGL